MLARVRSFLPLRFQIAAVILIVTGLIFWIWGASQKGRSETVVDESPRQAGEVSAAASEETVEAPPPKLSFKVENVILCGNRLVDHRTGEVIAEEWIKGFGKNAPPLGEVFPKERLVLVNERHGEPRAYGFDGKPRDTLKADGKPIGAAAFTERQVVYVREGDLWKGEVNWAASRVESVSKVTDVGYFKESAFSHLWFWHKDTLLLQELGKSKQVGLADGTVKDIPNNIRKIATGISPTGAFSVIPVGGAEIVVLDLVSEDVKRFRVPRKILGLLWLDESRVLMRMGQRHLLEYDHTTGKLEEPTDFGEIVRGVGALSPGGKRYLVMAQTGIYMGEVESGERVKLELPFDKGEWLSDEKIICSNPSEDSELRGVWLIDAGGGTKRLTNRPVDVNRAARGKDKAFAKVPRGAVLVSEGNLWRFDEETEAVKQLTQNGGFEPFLRVLETTTR